MYSCHNTPSYQLFLLAGKEIVSVLMVFRIKKKEYLVCFGFGMVEGFIGDNVFVYIAYKKWQAQVFVVL